MKQSVFYMMVAKIPSDEDMAAARATLQIEE